MFNKKEFAKIVLDKNIKTSIVYIISFNLRLKIIIYKAQKVKIAFENIKKVFKSITPKYSDFIIMF